LKTHFSRKLGAALALSVAFSTPAFAEDIDLFTDSGVSAATAPNILIVLDNSANWNANNQGWTDPNRIINPFKQGQSELRALRTLMDDTNINEAVNIGLFMFTSGNPADSGYPRFHIRNMTPVAKNAFKEMIGPDSGCVDGANSLNGTPNCIFKNFSSSSEQTNSASTRYSAALFEAFKYFGGYTEPAKAKLNQPGAPVDRTHFGNERYGVLDTKTDSAAWADAGKTRWASPFDSLNNASCAKNYIIFIGNGYPSQDVPDSLLTGINGNAAVPAGVGNKNWKVANWSKYMLTTDVNVAPGQQMITTFAIDVFNAQQDVNQTLLMKAMAKYGGGRYFEARNEQAIINALREIIIEIQAVNSVFASASLPINATNRSQNENQVFIGMFRPDPRARPRWYGNLKQYQVAQFGNDVRLADKDGKEAVSATTGFIQACATSFWSKDTGNYWDFSADSTGSCASATTSPSSDLPDGGVVEKGGAGVVVRTGNDPSAVAPFTVNRNLKTCTGSPCGALVDFNVANVVQVRTGAATVLEHTAIVNFSRGLDVLDEDGDLNLTEPRPSIHGDIAHSRPLPVNYGGSNATRGVVVYYGSNDGSFKAVEGRTGKELWSFIAPEHHEKLKRLYDNTPTITYPNIPVIPGAKSKDYFFDGSAGLYQNIDDTKVWIFPTMRRGGRMLYAFDVSTTTPVFKWSVGCPNMADDSGCTTGFAEIGQTWSAPNVAFIKGFNSGNDPVIVMGGGYDSCNDTDSAVTTCLSGNKGNRVYVINANNGVLLQTFTTTASVAADVTLVDRDFDGKVDYGYAADIRGAIYRIEFIDPVTKAAKAPGTWTSTKVAETTGAGRKFLFSPSALMIGENVHLALGSGDRERPLISNYPYRTPVQNRFYMFIDKFAPGVVNLDGPVMQDFSSPSTCSTLPDPTKQGWYMNLTAGQGEQVVTSSVIYGGFVFFSTNRPIAADPNTCAVNLGEARGYAVNLLNASGIIGAGGLCGGETNAIFTGGGIPPSPVVGTVPVTQPDGTVKPTSVIIGAANIEGGNSGPISAQPIYPPIQQIRSRLYWYPHGDK
jgi:type IV pilus assembly protein PilY1